MAEEQNKLPRRIRTTQPYTSEGEVKAKGGVVIIGASTRELATTQRIWLPELLHPAKAEPLHFEEELSYSARVAAYASLFPTIMAATSEPEELDEKEKLIFYSVCDYISRKWGVKITENDLKSLLGYGIEIQDRDEKKMQTQSGEQSETLKSLVFDRSSLLPEPRLVAHILFLKTYDGIMEEARQEKKRLEKEAGEKINDLEQRIERLSKSKGERVPERIKELQGEIYHIKRKLRPYELNLERSAELLTASHPYFGIWTRADISAADIETAIEQEGKTLTEVAAEEPAIDPSTAKYLLGKFFLQTVKDGLINELDYQIGKQLGQTLCPELTEKDIIEAMSKAQKQYENALQAAKKVRNESSLLKTSSSDVRNQLNSSDALENVLKVHEALQVTYNDGEITSRQLDLLAAYANLLGVHEAAFTNLFSAYADEDTIIFAGSKEERDAYKGAVKLERDDKKRRFRLILSAPENFCAYVDDFSSTLAIITPSAQAAPDRYFRRLEELELSDEHSPLQVQFGVGKLDDPEKAYLKLQQLKVKRRDSINP